MQKIDNLNNHLQDIDEDALNIRYDLSENKDHATLIIFRYEKDAKLIYNLLNGALPSIEDIVYMLEKYYSLQDIAIISGKLRKTVLSKAGSQLTVAYLENGSLLRSSNTYGS